MRDLTLSLLTRVSVVDPVESGRAFLEHLEELHPEPSTSRGDHATLTITDNSGNVQTEGAAGLLKRLAVDYGGDFGLVHTLTDEDVTFLRGAPGVVAFLEDEGPFLSIVQLEVCLPDLFWGTVLGPPYAELFGPERLPRRRRHWSRSSRRGRSTCS